MAEKPRKMGLGRGLSALMADVDVTSAAAPQSTQTVPVEQITANPDQPRRAFDPEALAELEHHPGLLDGADVRRAQQDWERIAPALTSRTVTRSSISSADSASDTSSRRLR